MAVSVENLKKCFDKIGVDLVIAKEPFVKGRGTDQIFAMDIRRKIKGNARTEYFLIYPGNEDCNATVAATDTKRGQLVLTVSEPERVFEEPVNQYDQKELDRLGAKGFKTNRAWLRTIDFVKRDNKWIMLRKTLKGNHHYLLGMDERQLFMCELKKACTSIADAHAQLKPATVVLAEGKQRGKVIRQGEWFFLHPTEEEETLLKAHLKKGATVVYKNASIGAHAGRREGKPHVAEQLVTMGGVKLEHGFTVRQRHEVFVKGAVKHPDHETVKFVTWRKVILNQEVTASRAPGSTWID